MSSDTLKSHCLDDSVIQRISGDQKMFDRCLKMRFTLLGILPTLLGILILHQAKSQSPKFTQSSWNLLPNVVVVNVDGSLVQHPLTCLGSFNREEEGWRRDNDWVWRRDGEEDEEILWMMGGEEKKKGNSFLVNLEERTGGGIFTCHSLDKTLLKNTTVLVKHLDEQKRILEGSTRTGYMKCSTWNYQGEFHCSWKVTTKRVGTIMSVRVARGLSDAENISCSVDASGQQWTCSSSSGQSDIMCSVNSSGLGLSCVDRQYCPYAEETDRITLTIYMRTNYLLEEYSQRFYLSEIVKPDKVSIKKMNSSTIEWSYPVSWNRPISYFPLSFQVKEIKGRERKNGCTCDSPCTKVHTTESRQWSVKAKVVVCVRSQDALCDSPWSDWTEYRHNKGNKRRRNRSRSLCLNTRSLPY